MCVVRINEDIKTDMDYQNLVIGVILGQEKKFTTNKIIKYVNLYAKRAELKLSGLQKKKIIRGNIDMLVQAGKIKPIKGAYQPNYASPSW